MAGPQAEKPLHLRVLNGYYYLAPLWLALEAFLFPGLRAGIVVGASRFWMVVFYGVEMGIGGALWRGLPLAEIAALAENLMVVVAACKFILLTPLDIAADLENVENAAALADSFASSMWGTIFSLVYVGFQARRQIRFLEERLGLQDRRIA